MKSNKPQSDVFYMTDVMAHTGLTRGTIEQLVRQKRIPYYKVDGKLVFFKKSEIDKWLTQFRSLTHTDKYEDK